MFDTDAFVTYSQTKAYKTTNNYGSRKEHLCITITTILKSIVQNYDANVFITIDINNTINFTNTWKTFIIGVTFGT